MDGGAYPAWINSDHLTLLGFLAQILAGVGYALSRWNRYWLMAVIGFLALNWLGLWMARWLACGNGSGRATASTLTTWWIASARWR